MAGVKFFHAIDVGRHARLQKISRLRSMHCTAGARGSFKVHRTSRTMIACKNLQSIVPHRVHQSVCFDQKQHRRSAAWA